MELLRNFDELLGAAMAIEEKGAAFYKKAAGFAKDALAQQLFLDLADWENNHYAMFNAARERLSPEEREIQTIAEDLDIESIIASGAIRLTKDPESLLTGSEAPEEVIDTAISLERDSVVFYMFLHRFVSDEERREELDVIVREEVGHVKKLQELRKRLSPTG